MKTLTELEALHPCREGLAWARQQPSLYVAWETCTKSDWMWWLLRKRNVSKDISVKYAQFCVDSVKHLNNKWAAAATAANATAAAATAANAAYAAYAAAAADAYAERLKQANFLRSIVPNPFEKP